MAYCGENRTRQNRSCCCSLLQFPSLSPTKKRMLSLCMKQPHPYFGNPDSESSGRYGGTKVLKFIRRFRRGPYVTTGLRPILKRPSMKALAKRNCARRIAWLMLTPTVLLPASITAPPDDRTRATTLIATAAQPPAFVARIDCTHGGRESRKRAGNISKGLRTYHFQGRYRSFIRAAWNERHKVEVT